MTSIFISYRRDDSAGYVGRIYDRLSSQFGKKNVFMDIDNIPPGEVFRDVIENFLDQCQIALIVINKNWATIKDQNGRRRLDNPNDFVKLEVETALNKGLRVIPVLVGGASMPLIDSLPVNLYGLAERNAFEITDKNFHHDIDTLISTIKTLPRQEHSQPYRLTKYNAGSSKWRWFLSMVVVSLLTLAIGIPVGTEESGIPWLGTFWILIPLLSMIHVIIHPYEIKQILVISFLVLLIIHIAFPLILMADDYYETGSTSLSEIIDTNYDLFGITFISSTIETIVLVTVTRWIRLILQPV